MEAAHRHAPAPLLPVGAHIAVALGALAIIASTVAFAGHASEDAVQNAQAALTPGMHYVVLPKVEVLAHRSTDAVACVPASANL